MDCGAIGPPQYHRSSLPELFGHGEHLPASDQALCAGRSLAALNMAACSVSERRRTDQAVPSDSLTVPERGD